MDRHPSNHRAHTRPHPYRRSSGSPQSKPPSPTPGARPSTTGFESTDAMSAAMYHPVLPLPRPTTPSPTSTSPPVSPAASAPAPDSSPSTPTPSRPSSLQTTSPTAESRQTTTPTHAAGHVPRILTFSLPSMMAPPPPYSALPPALPQPPQQLPERAAMSLSGRGVESPSSSPPPPPRFGTARFASHPHHHHHTPSASVVVPAEPPPDYDGPTRAQVVAGLRATAASSSPPSPPASASQSRAASRSASFTAGGDGSSSSTTSTSVTTTATAANSVNSAAGGGPGGRGQHGRAASAPNSIIDAPATIRRSSSPGPPDADGSAPCPRPGLLQPRLAVVLGLPPAWHPWLFFSRLLSVAPAVWWGLPVAARVALEAYALAVACCVVDGKAVLWGRGDGGGRGSKVVVDGAVQRGAGGLDPRTRALLEGWLRVLEGMLVLVWCGASAYLSYFFTDCLMSRWLLNYTPVATIVRLVAIALVNAYVTGLVVGIAAAQAGNALLLPAWIAIATALTIAHRATELSIAIRKETAASIGVVSIASFLSAAVLAAEVAVYRTVLLPSAAATGGSAAALVAQ